MKFFCFKSNKMCLFTKQVTISNEVNSSQLKYKIGSNGFLIITAPPVSGKIVFDSKTDSGSLKNYLISKFFYFV